MWIDLIDYREQAQRLLVQGKKSVHSEGCSEYQSCPLECEHGKCAQSLDLHTAMFWIAADTILTELILIINDLDNLTERQMTEFHTRAQREGMQKLLCEVSILWKVVHLHEDKYEKLDMYLWKVRWLIDNLMQWVRKQIEESKGGSRWED